MQMFEFPTMSGFLFFTDAPCVEYLSAFTHRFKAHAGIYTIHAAYMGMFRLNHYLRVCILFGWGPLDLDNSHIHKVTPQRKMVRWRIPVSKYVVSDPQLEGSLYGVTGSFLRNLTNS